MNFSIAAVNFRITFVTLRRKASRTNRESIEKISVPCSHDRTDFLASYFLYPVHPQSLGKGNYISFKTIFMLIERAYLFKEIATQKSKTTSRRYLIKRNKRARLQIGIYHIFAEVVWNFIDEMVDIWIRSIVLQLCASAFKYLHRYSKDLDQEIELVTTVCFWEVISNKIFSLPHFF